MEERKKDMKRLVGGDYQLDLSPIEIEESVDGETYTSITDKSVLDQLTGLKAFIGKSGMIKPIWVKLLNGETDELIVARGTLAVVDVGEFEICIPLDGYKLRISVEFTQMTDADDHLLDDWYIDANDAKYILISDTQSLAGELADFEGDVSITGDLTADSIVENMTGYSTLLPSTDEYREVDNIYVGVCKNGNKVTFVMFGSFKVLDDEMTPEQSTVWYSFNIPSEVGSKLFPFEIGGGYYLDNKNIQGIQKSDFTKVSLNLDVTKTSNTQINFGTSAFGQTQGETIYFRIEETFLLSDNLIPQS